MSAVTEATAPPRLVLVGAGHAHLRVLESLREDEWPRVEVVLVSPERRQFYSGMVPGYLRGAYDEAEPTLEIASLAERAGVRFIVEAATRVDGPGREVQTDAGILPFDLLSLDVGSIPGGLDRPGVRQHAFALRPMRRATALRRRVDALTEVAGRVRVAVVGAGAGGFEVALALHRRIREGRADPVVTLVDRGPGILEGYARSVRERGRAILAGRGIDLVLGEDAVAVDERGVALASGGKVEADLVVWSTGPAPPPLLAASTLPLADSGYLAVDRTLRAMDGSPVWGAGDCVDVAGHDLPKAGVFAVREGPVLAGNLRAAVTGGEAREYEPQSSFLSLLDTADGRALARWRSFVAHGRPAWWLKKLIDRRFVRRYTL